MQTACARSRPTIYHIIALPNKSIRNNELSIDISKIVLEKTYPYYFSFNNVVLQMISHR